MSERRVDMHWRGPIGQFMRDTTPEIDLEGALSCGKTTAALWKVWTSLNANPGIRWWIGRYGDGDTSSKIRPAFEFICQQAGGQAKWNSHELAYDFPNGSRCYAYGLKSPDAMSRYSKLRGMDVAGVYNDQTEELPEDIGLELRARIRQPGFPHQLIFSPNPPNVTHWLAQQFPITNGITGRRHYAISIHDNAHNLNPSTIAALLAAYPSEHAKHRSVILGQRGVNVNGVPVYKGHFVRASHIGPTRYSPDRPLLVAIDFGKHHPCMVVGQQPYEGGLHLFGGVLGQDLYLDDFLPIVQQTLARWFPSQPGGVQVCCDPAGSRENSQGTRFNGVDILRRFGYQPSWRDNANSPDVRNGALEAVAAHMRRRTSSGEAFQVEADPERWIRVSGEGPQHEPFLVDALEAGYVWDEHMVSVGNKQVRKPKKDGWFEHGMNCMEYLELTYGADRPTQEYQAVRKAQRAGRGYQRPQGPNAWQA